MEEEDSEKLRASNPEFAKLVDIVSGTYLEDSMPATARSKLRQVSELLEKSLGAVSEFVSIGVYSVFISPKKH